MRARVRVSWNCNTQKRINISYTAEITQLKINAISATNKILLTCVYMT
jgi:hypothetical protein